MYGPLLLVIALIVYGTLFPWHFDFASRHAPTLPWAWNRFLIRDVLLNLLLYVPLGAAAILAFTRRHGRAYSLFAASALGLALSATLEALQNFVPGRDPSLIDVACNFTGAIAGAVTALVFLPELNALLRRGSGRLRAPRALLLACWGTYQLYPFFPVLSRTRIFNHLHELLHPAAVAPVEIWASAAEWFAAGTPLAIVCLPLRMLIAGRSISLQEVLGALAAIALFVTIPERHRLRVAIVALASAIVLRELAPFDFSSAPTHFSWLPFSGALESERGSAVLVMFRKAFDYGAMVWLLRRAGLSYRTAAIGVAIPLAVLEAAQCYLPTRTPEITDPVLAILMAILLRMLSR